MQTIATRPSRIRWFRSAVVPPAQLSTLVFLTVGTITAIPSPVRVESVAAEVMDDRILRSYSNRPSHNGMYRVEVRPLTEVPRGEGLVARWSLHVADADGTPVEGATVSAVAWAPNTGELAQTSPIRGSDRGNGIFEMDALTLPSAGWWNVAIDITRSGIRDSVAFNLVLPSEPGVARPLAEVSR